MRKERDNNSKSYVVYSGRNKRKYEYPKSRYVYPRRINTQELLLKIGNPYLEMIKDKDRKCWVFFYKDKYYHPVWLKKRSDMSLDRWIYEAKCFIDDCERKEMFPGY